jgi:hypothetical protein
MEDSYVIIRPKAGSKKFQSMEGMKNYVNITSDGVNFQDQNIGTWDKERFPKSRQMFRPHWSKTKRRWMLKGFETNSPELNELVAKCKFKYRVGHPQVNQYIKETDIFDWSDPFMNHKSFRVIAQEGDTLLNKNHHFDQLVLAGLLEDPRFQYNSESGANTPFSNRVKYVIIDKGIEGNSRKISRQKSENVHELWKALTDVKKMAIAVSLGLVKDENTDREFVDDVLWDFATSKAQAKGSHLSKQDVFVEMCEMGTAKLNTQYLIGKAKAAGFLKHTKQGWMMFGVNIGRTDKAVEDYVNDTNNQELIDRLEKNLENT